MSYESKDMKMGWQAINGKQVPFVYPQYWSEEENDWIITSEENRLPVDAQLTGSTVELDVNAKIDKVEDLISNQNKIINVLQSDKLIFGIHYDRASDKTTRIGASEGMISEVGLDGELVHNDFDTMPIFGDMREVEDEYGNKFIRIPKFYVQKSSGKNHMTKRVSKTKFPGFYLPFVFWDFENKKELEYYDHGSHNASLSDDGKLESKPNNHPLVSANIVQFRGYSQENNDEVADVAGYQQLDVHAQDIIQTLFTIEFARLDSQSIMQGLVSGAYSDSHVVTYDETEANHVIVANETADQFVIGQSIGIGSSRGGNQVADARILLGIEEYDADNKELTFDGEAVSTVVDNIVYSLGWTSGFSADIAASSGSIVNNTNGMYPCMYRGIENPWGSLYQWVDGMNINDRQTWICKNADEYASNIFAHPYESVGYVNHDANIWVEEMGYDSHYPFVELPVKGGSSGTAYKNHYYQATGARIACVGGRFADGAAAGLWFWRLGDSSGASRLDRGGRLLRKSS